MDEARLRLLEHRQTKTEEVLERVSEALSKLVKIEAESRHIDARITKLEKVHDMLVYGVVGAFGTAIVGLIIR